MSRVFDDLMKGLDEVEAYLNGTETGYRVHEPEAVNRALGVRKSHRNERSRRRLGWVAVPPAHAAKSAS
jgi:hypothetical protein